jgi:hypothetical protein
MQRLGTVIKYVWMHRADVNLGLHVWNHQSVLCTVHGLSPVSIVAVEAVKCIVPANESECRNMKGSGHFLTNLRVLKLPPSIACSDHDWITQL